VTLLRSRGVAVAAVLATSLASAPASLAADRGRSQEPRRPSASAAQQARAPVRQSRLPEIAGVGGALALLLLSLGAVRRREPSRTTAWRLGPWLVIAAFAAAEVVLIATGLAGPTIDEALYVASGLRTLQGHGFGDYYLTWFSGSLLWPALAGDAYELLGLVGPRLLALVSVVAAMVATVKATGNLFGERARFFAALFLATSGPVLMLAHMAVYDALAVAGVAISFWCVTELPRRDHRAWLVAAALSLAVGVLAKYPALLFAAPPLTALLVLLRRERAPTDLALFCFIGVVLPMILFLSERGQFTELFTNNLALQSESFGAKPRTVAYAQAYFTTVPALLALAGWVAARGRRLVATALAIGLVPPVAYHLAVQNGVSDHKHAVFGIVFAAPLAGLALAAAGRDWPRRVAMAPALAALVVLGVVQMDRLDRGSPDLRLPVAYLRSHMHPGQQLLINNAWPFIAGLYGDGPLDSPWDVYDVYRLKAGQARGDVCDYDWLVDVPGGSSWPNRVLDRVRRCGRFREVFIRPEQMVGLTNDRLDFIDYTGYARIWKNVARRRSG
jgi:Dolichyl-phosphate-mannose-protein mannosyltransferase